MSTTSDTLAFAGPEHDLSGGPTRGPALTYIVAGTPGGGSDLLCHGLRQTGVLGMPLEYLDLDGLADALGARWGVDEFGAYLDALFRHRTDAGGTFGMAVHWHQLARVYRELRGHHYGPGLEGDLSSVVRRLFGEVRWVFVQRRDRDAQAVATVRALSTGPLDHDAVHRARQDVDASVAAWEQFFFITDVHPHRVIHEDLIGRPEQVVAGLARVLEVDVPVGSVQAATAPEDHRQIDQEVRRYRRERLRRTAAERGRASAPPAAGPSHGTGGTTGRGSATPPGFVIAGTGRSGSGFIANVLQKAGIRCGHEQYYVPPGGHPIPGLDGDSSWLAVPELGRVEGPVLLQLRHPLDVIRSLVGIRMFTDPVHGAYQRFAFQHLPQLTGADDTLDAMLWYVEWNERAEAHAGLVYRVEDVDAALLQRIAAAAGHRIGRTAAAGAIAAVPSNFNSRPRAALEWDELPAGALRDRVQAFATRHGYRIDTATTAERVLSGR